MRTIKLVIIGDSGVGKTSLRSNYISGRFSTGYRATIGTDFITKTLPHHSKPGEAVTLQIWDTAGQERFSSLSTAFFRGADAVLMMYDVNSPATLQGLRKWWREFQERAPVPDEYASEYCCVVVGNKIDLAEELEQGRKMAVSEEDARTLLEELIPTSPTSSPTAPQPPHDLPRTEIHAASPIAPEEVSSSHLPNGNGAVHLNDSDGEESFQPMPIDIRFGGHSGNRQSASRATSRSRYGGTMTTSRTGISVYHTPSSSLFDEYVSAPSSPIHSSLPSNATSRSRTTSTGISPDPHRRRATNASTASSVTITPSLFTRPASLSRSPPPTSVPLDRGPKLFLVSAKTGYSVPSVFQYIATRVVSRWEWEESVQDRTFDFTEGRSSEIRAVRLSNSTKDTGWASTCCA